ncbi:hypothetical protein N9T89_00215 [Candidatus Actinomarina]|jgi:hypothetical protein|nr:hypothetical protein [Candidatus Actinomarina sp.]
MKSFFASTDKENAQQAGYLFLITNLLGFVTTGLMGMEAPPGELLVSFLWGLSLAGIFLTIKPLLGDNVPDNWREGTTFLAAAIFAGNCLTLGSDGNEFGPFFFFICLNMVALYAVSEGVIGNIWRYNLLVGGLMGVIFAGAGTFFGYEPPEALMPLQLVLWITFILGLGVGPLLAWRDR